MTRIKGKMFLAAAISFILTNAGCASFLAIQTPVSVSDYPEIFHCITNPDSHGQCDAKDLGKDLKGSSLYADGPEGYFEALREIEIPEKLSEKESARLSEKSFIGEPKDYYNFFSRAYSKTNHLINGSPERAKTNHLENGNPALAESAQKTMLTKSNINIHTLFYQQMADESATVNAERVEFDADDLGSYVGDMVESFSYDGLVLFQHEVNKRALRKLSELPEGTRVLKSETREKMDNYARIVEDINYTQEYLKAYFHQYKFIKVKIKAGKFRAELENRVSEQFPFLDKEHITLHVDELFRKVTGLEFSEICPNENDCNYIIEVGGKLDSTQFVTRSGIEYGFPYVTVSFDPLADEKLAATIIDWNKVGADIVRVLVEAVGDRIMGLPADASSTLCIIDTTRCYILNNGISVDEFSAVNEFSAQIEMEVSSAAGLAVRGFWWASLNNEALAKIIETTAGAVAKKFAEKFAYCVYSCTADERGNRKSLMSRVTLRKIRVKVKN